MKVGQATRWNIFKILMEWLKARKEAKAKGDGS
jgi:hypothetical protein